MYIVFEGIDGAGKSTQIKLLKDWLEQNGFDVETVVEPTDSEVGKLIRKILQRPDATTDRIQKTLGLPWANALSDPVWPRPSSTPSCRRISTDPTIRHAST